MKTTMSSRERLLSAMELEESDHVPLWCLWSHRRDPFNRKDNLKRIYPSWQRSSRDGSASWAA